MVYLDLLKGDCLQILKDISSNTIDCFICDLPYGCLASGFHNTPDDRFIDGTVTDKKIVTPGCAWDIKINLEDLWKEIKRLAKNEHTPILMFCTTKFGNELINSNPSWFRYDLVWDKGRGVSFLTANRMPMRSHEMIYVFSKSGAFYNRIDEPGEPYYCKKNISSNCYKQYKEVETINTGTRCVKSVIRVDKKITSDKHPTEKPIDLYKWLIERYCPPGGTILDPTAGSFNSCFAAYELNRNSIGIEKDDAFYKKACEKADLL
jgi:site-specific DNA-methyltransferase (adenine-specific)